MNRKITSIMTALICLCGMNAWALDQKDGAYQIGTAEDLVAFAGLINGGESGLNAVLTADIDMSDVDGSEFMINGFSGIFDGQGHTLTVNIQTDQQRAALFTQTNGNALIKNLTLRGSIETSQKFAGGFIGQANDNTAIENCACYIEINSLVVGDGTHGGFFGYTSGNGTVKAINSLFAGSINGEQTDCCGGISGWNEVTLEVTNCLLIGEMNIQANGCGTFSRGIATNVNNTFYKAGFMEVGDYSKGTKVTTTLLANGEVAFLLNGDQSEIAWYQTLGEDAYPVLNDTHGRVYSATEMRCDGKIIGEAVYTNDATQASEIPAHQYENDVCVVCGQFNPDFLEMKDGFYQISDGAQLVKFMHAVNAGNNKFNAQLTADIDMADESANFLPIGRESAMYCGTFDGQGHRIKNLNLSLNQPRVGVFGVIQSPAVIKNFILDKSCFIETTGNYAGIIGSAMGTKGPVYLENLGMEGTIHLAGYNGAGIIGNNQGDAAYFNMKNCYVSGDVTADGKYSGALTGWAGANAVFENCWVIGQIFGTDNETSYFIRGLGGNSSIKNCFCKYGTQVTVITDEQVASGELCFMLNGDQNGISWYQTIGEDGHPVLDTSHGIVYNTAEKRCDGTFIGENSYTNDASQVSDVPDHIFENGVCTVCGQKQEGFMEPDAEGFYNISEGSQLVWFASAVNNGEGNLKARLVADIDMMDYSEKFRPIGSESAMFSGTFDGQDHRIINLNISLNQPRVGVFGVIQSPATIKNFILDESCTIETTGNYAGIIGSAWGKNGPVYMENLGMEGTIHLAGYNGGGIIGNNQGNAAYFNMKNCYVSGNVIPEGGYSGALTGWAGDNAVFENCWVIGQVTGTDNMGSYFIRGLGGNSSIKNCYSKEGTQVPNITDEQVASGELCYLLNGESFINPTWFQTLGEDEKPVWDSTHGTVYKAGEEFGDVHDEASFATFKNTFLDAEKEYCETVIAEQALIDVYAECIENMENYKTIEEFAAAYNEFKSMRTLIESSALGYAALQAKADEVIAYLETHNDFEGEKRDQLEFYLTESGEPNELYPNGTVPYIMETHTMSEEEVKAETAKIDKMLEEAIATGFTPHSDITTLLTNADFSNGYNGWEGKVGTATSSPCAECKNATCDFYQTLTDLKNGVYELQMNGYFRPGNPTSDAGNLTSTNYGAMLYANGIQNYVMAAIEDMVSVDDAVHGENCYINDPDFPYVDYSIYNDNGDLIGYVPGGQRGMKYAAMGGRYLNRVLVNVTDGQLTVGFRMPGTGVANDLMGIANVKLFYHGTLEEASEQLDATLQDMAARAQTLCDYEASYGADYAQYPNFSAELRAALKTAIDAVATTSDVEGKYALVGTFSDLFQQVYENKKVYIRLMDEAETLMALSESLASLLSDQDVEEMNNAIAEIYEAYLAGTATDEMINDITNRLTFLPKQVNGLYQIGDAKNLSVFSAIVNGGANNANAVLTADIDMTEYSAMYLPIGCESSVYSGTFDGQGHRIKNLNISLEQDCVGLFGMIQSPAVIKNFILDESCTIDGGGNYCAIIGQARGASGPIFMEKLGMEGTIHLKGWNGAGIIGNNMHSVANFQMKNCYVTGNVTADGGYSGALTGYAGPGALFENCWVTGQITGTDNAGSYFVRGMESGSITNCYSKEGSQATNITDEQVTSGELCYLLNGDQSVISWYQTIGEDPHPVFDASHSVVIKNEDGSYGNITGIETLSDSPRGEIDGSVYDLSGRKVSKDKLSKGIYIINGKKVLIK